MTSYDYDAPISEAGWVTPKFDSIRNVIRKYVTYDVPEAPAPIPLIEIPSISLTKVADVLALAKEGEPVASPTPLTFELRLVLNPFQPTPERPSGDTGLA